MVTNFTIVYNSYSPGNAFHNPIVLYYKKYRFGNFHSCNYNFLFVKCVIRKLYLCLQIPLACMLWIDLGKFQKIKYGLIL